MERRLSLAEHLHSDRVLPLVEHRRNT